MQIFKCSGQYFCLLLSDQCSASTREVCVAVVLRLLKPHFSWHINTLNSNSLIQKVTLWIWLVKKEEVRKFWEKLWTKCKFSALWFQNSLLCLLDQACPTCSLAQSVLWPSHAIMGVAQLWACTHCSATTKPSVYYSTISAVLTEIRAWEGQCCTVLTQVMANIVCILTHWLDTVLWAVKNTQPCFPVW